MTRQRSEHAGTSCDGYDYKRDKYESVHALYDFEGIEPFLHMDAYMTHAERYRARGAHKRADQLIHHAIEALDDTYRPVPLSLVFQLFKNDCGNNAGSKEWRLWVKKFTGYKRLPKIQIRFSSHRGRILIRDNV